MNKEEIIKFKEGLDQLNIYLSEHQYLQFRQFFDMLEEKNKVMNLTAITDGVEVVQKHFIDSLTIVKSHDMMEVDSVIDIGTGAGFPGIPIKIAFPHLEMLLVDSPEKRVNFVNEVIDALGLDVYKRQGLYSSPGVSATASAAAWAKVLFLPTTKVSKV